MFFGANYDSQFQNARFFFQMSANRVHLWNSLLCPPLGFGLNFLLLWLILRRTPKEMVVHSRVLLQTCLLDCLVLLMETVAQAVQVSDENGNGICFFDGYFIKLFGDSLPPTALLAIYLLWYTFANISVGGIEVQFMYRYVVLNRNKPVFLRQYLLYLAVPTIAVCAVSCGFLVECLRTLNYSATHLEYFANVIDVGQPPLFFTATIKGPENGIIFLTQAAFYAVIFFCGWKMTRFVRNHAAFNPRMRELNKQLTRTLIILASFPLLVQLLFLLMQIDKLLNNSGGHVEPRFYGYLVYHWIPVLNPLASILTNRPYREAIFKRGGGGGRARKLLCCLKNNADAVVVLSNNNNNNNNATN